MANPSPAPEVLAKLAEVDASAARVTNQSLIAAVVYRPALEAALTALAAAQVELDELARWKLANERVTIEAALVEENAKLRAEANRAQDQLAAATREAETLREALRPFAAIATLPPVCHAGSAEHEYGLFMAAPSQYTLPAFTVADVRRAVAALAPRSPEGEERT